MIARAALAVAVLSALGGLGAFVLSREVDQERRYAEYRLEVQARFARFERRLEHLEAAYRGDSERGDGISHR